MVTGEVFAARMMRFTGKLRHIFGPAAIGNLDEPVKEPTEAQRRGHEEHMAQFTVERLPNGRSYLVAKDPSDGSNLR